MLQSLLKRVHCPLEYGRCRGDSEEETGVLKLTLVSVDSGERLGGLSKRQLKVCMREVQFSELLPIGQ